MTTGRVARKNEFLDVEAKLLLCLRHDPHIGLIAVIDRVRIWILRSEAIVNAEDWDFQTDGPLSRVTLVHTGIHTAETTSMEVNDGMVILLRLLGRDCSTIEQ